jgi:hypothetical protein
MAVLSKDSGLEFLGLNAGSVAYKLCDLKQVSLLLCASSHYL